MRAAPQPFKILSAVRLDLSGELRETLGHRRDALEQLLLVVGDLIGHLRSQRTQQLGRVFRESVVDRRLARVTR